MTIIPAIDIIDGRCVRLTRGDFSEQKIYHEDPLEMAKQFEGAGMKRLHLVDLDGAKAGTPCNWKTLERIATHTNLDIDFSGGIHQQKMIHDAINAGARFITLGSIAVRSEMLVSDWIRSFGASHFIIATDVLDGYVMIKGWTEATKLSVFDMIARYMKKGIRDFLCTDISHDGMLSGPSIELYKNILQQQQNIRLIASGGVSCLNDIDELRKTGCSAVIIGKAFYENKISLKDVMQTYHPLP
jgi:phosphoribosylformimino-5-aminoimidazole carboxamide ribotide isomerase